MGVRFGTYHEDLSEAMGELHTREGSVLIPHEDGYMIVDPEIPTAPTPPKPVKPYVPKFGKCRCRGIKHPQGCNQDALFMRGLTR